MGLRLFIGITLPEEIKDSIERICFGIPKVNWIKKENLHLTIKFIGEVETDVLGISEVLKKIEFNPFDIQLKSVGVFKSKFQSVLWAGVENNPELEKLNQKINSNLNQLGIPSEKQSFHPHITLARLKEVNWNKVNHYLDEFKLFETVPFAINEFQLFSSVLSPKGSIYTVEESFKCK